MSKPSDNLPTLSETTTAILDYELEDFQAVKEEDSDKQTTIADLAQLNNHLAIAHAALPCIRTIDSLCSLTNAVCKLIELRRKVKKLPLGDNKSSVGRTWEVLE